MKINDDVRKVMMAGLGALSAVAEKTQETIDALAKRGEEALDHGQVLNERLRHTIQQAINEEEPDTKSEPETKSGVEDILRVVDSLSPEELKAVREKLDAMKHDDEQ